MSAQQFSGNNQSLLALGDIEFLQKIVKRYPEARLLAGPAEASPEGNQELKDTGIAYQVFDETTSVHQTAIEADRTFLGLLLVKAALNEDRSKFPKLSDANWQGLVDLTNDVVTNDADLNVVLYALTAQDLGKTQALVDVYKAQFGMAAEDHDKLLVELTRAKPDMFPGFQALSVDNQQAYVNGLAGDLNLGQLVQGENLPCNLTTMAQTDDRSRRLRLITELYDFAGVTGHVMHSASILMNDDNYTAFSSALEALKVDDSVAAYTGYIAKRGQLAGLVNAGDDLTADPEKFVLSRIVALSRAFTPEQGQQIKTVWGALPEENRATLTQEMSITGMKADEPKGILIYYSSAVIANAIKAKGDFSEGLSLGLQALAKTYHSVRPHIGTGLGQVTVNVNGLAKLAASNPDRIAAPIVARSEGTDQLFTLDV
ncbi:MAG: hypothetical protein LRY36_00335 [Alphaproteobacteria bacterium]|nr:hypothetical protein [Alphaproteobacteria bacterium]